MAARTPTGTALWASLILLGAALAPAAAQTPLTQFHHGPDHTGTFAAPGPGALQHQRWIYRTGNRMVASAVVADGIVFVGGMDGRMHAIDRNSGHARWQFPADGPISATAAVAQGLVFFQSDANTVYALNAADGTLRWRRTTGPSRAYHNYPSDPDGADWDYFASSPLYANGRIYIGSGDGRILSLDAATGAPLWTVQTGSRVRATPATDGTTIYTGSFDGVMYALDARTGAEKWRFKTEGNPDFPVGEIQSSAALAGGMVLFGSRDYQLYAVNCAGKTAMTVPGLSAPRQWQMIKSVSAVRMPTLSAVWP